MKTAIRVIVAPTIGGGRWRKSRYQVGLRPIGAAAAENGRDAAVSAHSGSYRKNTADAGYAIRRMDHIAIGQTANGGCGHEPILPIREAPGREPSVLATIPFERCSVWWNFNQGDPTPGGNDCPFQYQPAAFGDGRDTVGTVVMDQHHQPIAARELIANVDVREQRAALAGP